ncbi:uncharacterized protein LOC106666154 isoform X3 [Cimex lectularius]|uniref:Uncharacterized protein n=1 Tax=Cimex lectularius TaxID=79782 RepID=A0A8I6RP77_CIMLE|nr:uncharacterized protein LOC106666154 isoform X3 [Cimex lectularius]
MPGLHNGSICWGNRKSFSEFADFHHSPTMRPPSHVSAGTYYGYERVHAVGAPPPDDESMDTTAAPDCDGNEESRRAHARKRQAADLGSERNKRIRQEASLALQLRRDALSSHVKSNNLGHCLV